MGRHRQFDVERALEAAMTVFWRKGFEATSYEDLTLATGVARPGLYSAFGNKDSLFRQVVQRYNERYLDFETSALGEPTSLRVAERLLRGSAELCTRYPERPGCLGLNGAMACSEGVEPLRQMLVQGRASFQTALCERFEQLQDEGDLPAGADCGALAALIMTVVQGMAVQAKAGTVRDVLYAVADQVLQCWPGRRGSDASV